MKLKYCIRYALFWCGMPQSKNMRKGDVVLAQSFGRNSWDEIEMKKLKRKFRETESDEKTLEWIRNDKFDPGKPNREIAKIVVELLDEYHIPAIVQWEIATAFSEEWYAQHKKEIICIWPPEENEHFDTRSVIIESAEVIREKNFVHPVVVAHKQQIVRTALIVKKYCGIFPLTSKKQPNIFDAHSIQWWTRNIFFWSFREFFVRVRYIVKRYV